MSKLPPKNGVLARPDGSRIRFHAPGRCEVCDEHRATDRPSSLLERHAPVLPQATVDPAPAPRRFVRAFKVGDVVQLKSGGRSFTVRELKTNFFVVVCWASWEGANWNQQELHEDCLQPEELPF